MNATTYQTLASRTAPRDDQPEQRLCHLSVVDQTARVLAATYASAGAADDLKRHVFYGAPFDREKSAEGVDIRIERVIEVFRHTPRIKGKATAHLLHALLGIVSEAGELLELLLDPFSGDFDLIDAPGINEELGDLMWYIALAAGAIGSDLSNIMASNIAKLQARYPDAFSEADALDRDLDAERQAMK